MKSGRLCCVPLLGMSLILAGCVKPMIDIPKVPVSNLAPEGNASVRALDTSIAEAEGLRNAYLGAASNISTAREVSAVGILGLSAAALGIIATGGAGQFPVAAGIGGATWLGLGGRTLTTAQQNIYFAGAQALTCALQSQTSVKALTNDSGPLLSAVVGLDSAIVSFAAFAPTGNDATLLSIAATVQAKAHDLLGRVETAGYALHQQTYAIKIAVDKQTVQSEPDLQSITSVVSGVLSSAGGLVPGFGGAAVPKSPAGTQGGRFRPAGQTADQARHELNSALAAVQPFLTRADAIAQASGALAACLPSPAAQAVDAANKAVAAAQTAQQAATDAQAAATKAAASPPTVRPPTVQPPVKVLSNEEMQKQDKDEQGLRTINQLRTQVGFADDDAKATITWGIEDSGVMRRRLASLHDCFAADKNFSTLGLQSTNPHGWLYFSFFSLIGYIPSNPIYPDATSTALKACVAKATAAVPSAG